MLSNNDLGKNLLSFSQFPKEMKHLYDLLHMCIFATLYPFVRLAQCTIIFVNKFRSLENQCILQRFTTEYSLVKMQCMTIIIHLQQILKNSNALRFMGDNCWKYILMILHKFKYYRNKHTLSICYKTCLTQKQGA